MLAALSKCKGHLCLRDPILAGGQEIFELFWLLRNYIMIDVGIFHH